MFLNIFEEINNLDKHKIEVFNFPDLNDEFILLYNNKKINLSQFILYKAFSQKNIIYEDFYIRYAYNRLFHILSTEIFVINYEYMFIYIIELADTYQVHNLMIKNKKFHYNIKKKLGKILKIIDKNIFYKYYTTNDIYLSKDKSEKYRKDLAFFYSNNIREELLEITLKPERLEYFLTNDEKIKYGIKII